MARKDGKIEILNEKIAIKVDDFLKLKRDIEYYRKKCNTLEGEIHKLRKKLGIGC